MHELIETEDVLNKSKSLNHHFDDLTVLTKKLEKLISNETSEGEGKIITAIRTEILTVSKKQLMMLDGLKEENIKHVKSYQQQIEELNRQEMVFYYEFKKSTNILAP